MTVGTLIDLAVGLNAIDRDTEIDIAPHDFVSADVKKAYSDPDNNRIVLDCSNHDYLKNLDLIWEEENNDIQSEVS